MTDFVIAVILAILIVITIMHDISIYRLGRKVDILQAFIDTTLRGLQGYVLKEMSNADQRIQSVESVKSVENNGDIIVRSNLEPFRVADTPQNERSE